MANIRPFIYVQGVSILDRVSCAITEYEYYRGIKSAGRHTLWLKRHKILPQAYDLSRIGYIAETLIPRELPKSHQTSSGVCHQMYLNPLRRRT